MKIFSFFPSFNGEVTGLYQGSMCVFIRFCGCNLRCSYCDTPYAQDQVKHVSLEPKDLVSVIKSRFPWCKNITLTGGEPLYQRLAFDKLCLAFKGTGWQVSVETNGTVVLPRKPKYPLRWVLDCKLPSSGVDSFLVQQGIRANWSCLSPWDFIKFVVGDRDDFDIAVGYLRQWDTEAKIAFSPMEGSLDPKLLVQWMIDEGLGNAVFNLQLHKVVYGKLPTDGSIER
jgi:7-carboxy-7-deazaguanine synthase